MFRLRCGDTQLYQGHCLFKAVGSNVAFCALRRDNCGDTDIELSFVVHAATSTRTRACMPGQSIPPPVTGARPCYFDNGSLMSRYSTTYFSTFDGRGAEP